MIGGLQEWALSLGILDIQTVTMRMSCFRAATREGPIDHLKWMYCYLKKFSSAAIQVRSDTTDFAELLDQEFEGCQSLCSYVDEALPKDLPKPMGKWQQLLAKIPICIMI
jgi:hypothetical protein